MCGQTLVAGRQLRKECATVTTSSGQMHKERQHYYDNSSCISHLQPILAYNLHVAVLCTDSTSCPVEVITKPRFTKTSIADRQLPATGIEEEVDSQA